MNEYIEHPKIKPNTIQARIYQQKIFFEAVKENTLVILPTGLGKTIVMVMVAAHYLQKFPGQKVVISAPTRPLVDQHLATMQNMLDILESEVIILSGSTSPTKRKKLWQEATVIITTPQTLRNDIVSNLVDLNNVSLLCFDECHRAVGDDPYVLSAEQYNLQNPAGRVLGFTASPRDEEKLVEIVQNLGITNISYMDDTDPQVKRYIHGADNEWVWINLPDEIKKILDLLTKYAKLYLKDLHSLGLTNSTQLSRNPKRNLVKIPTILNNKKQTMEDDEYFKGMIAYGQLMLVTQAIEMLETQGIRVLKSFFDGQFEKFRTERKNAQKRLLTHDLIQEAIELTDEMVSKKISHPKLQKLKDVVMEEVKSPDARVLVFSNYKATSEFLVEELEELPGVKVHRFVGQSSSHYGRGLSQKEQKQVMDSFRAGDYNVLISTSVGEEGLDVAQVDLVVFYDVTPSSTRLIQRSGRTGRARKGRVVIFITKGTRDEGYFYASQSKRRKIKGAVDKVVKELDKQKKELTQVEELKNNESALDNYLDFEEEEPEGPVEETDEVVDDTPRSQEILDAIADEFDGDKVVIYIDHREKGSGLLRELLKMDIEIRQLQLPIGDFILSKRVGVERKTIEDFCNSVINQNIFSQLRELSNTYPKPMLILEGDKQMQCRLNPAAFQGALSSVLVDYNIPVIRTENSQETIAMMYAIAKREQRQKKNRPHLYQPGSSTTLLDEQISLLSSLPNINIVLAEKLLNHFGSPSKIFRADPEDLQKVHGIGKAIAYQIHKVLSSEVKEDLPKDN